MTRLNLSHRKNEKGIALLGGLFLVLFLSIMIGSVMLRAEMQLREADMKIDSHHAFYAAEAGLERVLFELRRDSAWRPGPTETNVEMKINKAGVDQTLGFYSLAVADAPLFNNWESVWVRSVGVDEFSRVPRILQARVIIANPSRFLVLTLGNLKVGSGASVDFDIFGQDISFEVNETLPSPEKDIFVNGDVLYLRSVRGETNPAVHINPDNTISRSPSISFAGVDIDHYRQLAQDLQPTGGGFYSASDLTFDLDDLETMTGQGAPDIIYADGDIFVKGNYSSSVLVVAKGSVYIQGEILPVVDADTGNRPQIGLLADKDVVIPETVDTVGGNLAIEAFIMADGEGAAEGGFYAQGPRFSKETLNFTGAMAVRGQGETAIDLNVFKERNYVFNSLLNSNRSIPFIPFIANIAAWEEIVNPNAHPFPPS